MNPDIDSHLISHKLKNALQENLPGREAHLLMDPLKDGQREWPQDAEPRESAVLILFYWDGTEYRFPLTKRPEYSGHHSGQVALPGGKYEEVDADLIQTALRETEEEIGVTASSVTVLGQLSDIYIPPSNFNIKPVVGWVDERPNFVLDPREVAKLFEPSVTDLLNGDLRTKKGIRLSNNVTVNVPCFDMVGEVVWGATAMILSELAAVIERIKNE